MSMEDEMAKALYGISKETYEKLVDTAVERLEGRNRKTAMLPYIENLETEERPIREKLVLAVILGQLSAIQ